jgi:hypothetical protein
MHILADKMVTQTFQMNKKVKHDLQMIHGQPRVNMWGYGLLVLSSLRTLFRCIRAKILTQPSHDETCVRRLAVLFPIFVMHMKKICSTLLKTLEIQFSMTRNYFSFTRKQC